jgi:D-inositol-3-phosphate glycosyltransferase
MKGDDQLKIAMLSVHSCPLGKLGGESTGGMSVYVRELCREIGKRGHIVDVYTRAHDPEHDQIVELGKNARLIHVLAGKNEEIDKLSIYPHLSEFAHEVERFRRRYGLHYDLIHSHYWLSGWVGKRMQKWWDIPHVTMFHTLGAVKNAADPRGAEPQLRINSEKALIRDCHRIIAPTEREKENLINYYGAMPEAVTVIPCGVNLDLFRLVEKVIARRYLGLDGERIILFVGRIVPLKGVDKLLMAFPYLKSGLRLKILVVGGDEHCHAEMGRLKSLAKSLRIHNSVSFLGLVKHEELPYFYGAADLCVLPSYYESFGLVALESLACGTPVVGTNVGGLEDIIRQGETGYVVADNAPFRLASKISMLLSKKEAKSSIRSSVMEFSWSKIAETMVNEYRAVLGSSLRKWGTLN